MNNSILLPFPAPPHVRIIISTSQQRKFGLP